MSERSELALERMAIKRRWDIPEDARAKIVARAIQFATQGDARLAMAAIKLVKEMEGQNQKDEHFTADLDEFKQRVLDFLNDGLPADGGDAGPGKVKEESKPKRKRRISRKKTD